MFYKIIRNIFLTNVMFCTYVQASFTYHRDLWAELDIPKTNLPLSYFNAEKNDEFTFIYQRCYKVYNIPIVQTDFNQHEVAVIGFLSPCMGIAVTDTKKLVVFHKDWTNSLSDMNKILHEELDLNNKNNLYARIFSVHRARVWNESFASLHNGLDHRGEMKRVKDSLVEHIGIPRTQILAQLNNLRDYTVNETLLKKYEVSQFCVAIRLNNVFKHNNEQRQIEFTSIDPYYEDILHLKKQFFSDAEFFEIIYGKPNLDNKRDTKKHIPYLAIPALLQSANSDIDTYTVADRMGSYYMNKLEEIHKARYVEKNSSLIDIRPAYNQTVFYHISSHCGDDLFN